MADRIFEDIFLFVIEQPDKGYAEFRSVYKHVGRSTCVDAIAHIDEVADSQRWGDVTQRHKSSGLDMRFASGTEALVLVKLPDALEHVAATVFADDAVKMAPVRKKPVDLVYVHNPHAHSDVHGNQTIASFRIDLRAAAGELNSRMAGHRTSRLPIMFNFVDSDGMSPVFKAPHAKVDHSHDNDHLRDKNHGGIHPPGASSIIEIDP